eukprot:6175500-Pleurochrysis_carterae.AAC.2
MSKEALRKALLRHSNAICNALMSCGCIDWLPSFFAVALKSLGMFDELMWTRAVAEVKLQFVNDLADVLSTEWGASLALFIKNELCMSDADYSSLRLAFCKRYNPGRELWEMRVWYRCEVTKKVVGMPEPLIAKHRWHTQWRGYVEKHGLSLSKDGPVCERSLRDAAAELIQRDRPMLVDPAQSEWYLTFGIDGTAISGKRKFTHAALSLGAMYKDQRVVLTELKAATLAIGQHHDDASGLKLMLRRKRVYTGKESGGSVTSIADEINAIYAINVLHVAGGEQIPCRIRCCVDLIAARGICGSRGKSACYCGCQGNAGRQMLPGNGVVDELPEGDGLEVWQAGHSIMRKHCSYGSDLMSFTSLRDAAHVPPLDHDFVSGPWVCQHCNRTVYFSSRSEFDSAKASVSELKERGRSGDNDQALTEYNKIMWDHAEGHLDQTLYVEPVLDAATSIFVVDPLHRLQLNLMKVAFKYIYVDDERQPAGARHCIHGVHRLLSRSPLHLGSQS